MKSKLIKNFAGVGIMKLVSIPVGLATSVILARVLGPEKFGQYAFIMALIPLLALPVSGGLPQLLTREVATFAYMERWELYKGAIKAAHVWVAAASITILVFFFLVSSFSSFFPTEEKWTLLPIAILSIPLLGLGAVRNGAIKGLGMPAYAEVPQQLIQPSLILIFYSSAAFLGLLTAETAIWGQVSSSAIVFVFASWMFFSVRPAQAACVKPEFQWGSWGRSLLPFSLLALVSTFNTQVGVVFLGILSTDDQVAAMRVAERAGQFVVLSLTLVNMVIAPYIVKAFRDGDKLKLQNLAKKSARGSFLLSAPIALVLILGGESLIRLVFGEDYGSISYFPLVIIVVGQLVNVFFGSVGHFLSMSGNEKFTLSGQVVAVLSNILLCFILIPSFGAVGAALAVAISIGIWNVLLAYFVLIKLKIRPTAF